METNVLVTRAAQETSIREQDIEKAIAPIYAQNIETAKKIREIVNGNIAAGRYQSAFIVGFSVESYVELVFQTYQAEAANVTALQVEKSDEKWQALYTQLAKWAYSYFVRKNFKPGIATMDLAQDQASEACIQILRSPFPYDVSFELWAHRLLLNVCSKHLRTQSRRAKNIPTQAIDDLTETLPNHEDSPEDHLQLKVLQQDILEGINQLKDTRAQVVLMHYFEAVPFSEIARQMGKSVAAIHSLHFQALANLRNHMDHHP
jgi:RNA polymerase sigma factor (sigma-70 family)